MKIPISRFNASNVNETRSISSVFPTFEASSGKRGPGKHDLCSDQLSPATSPHGFHGGPHIWSVLVDRIAHFRQGVIGNLLSGTNHK